LQTLDLRPQIGDLVLRLGQQTVGRHIVDAGL